MKGFTVFLSLILIAMIGFCVFFYVGGTLDVQMGSISANAAEYPDAFNSIRNVIASGSAPQIFSGDPLDDPKNYTLLDINLTLTNRGILTWNGFMPRSAAQPAMWPYIRFPARARTLPRAVRAR